MQGALPLGGTQVQAPTGYIEIPSGTLEYFINSSESFHLPAGAIIPSYGQIEPSNTTINNLPNGGWAYFGTSGAGANIDPMVQIYENYIFTHPTLPSQTAPLPVVNIP
jgi:hypothetical protein